MKTGRVSKAVICALALVAPATTSSAYAELLKDTRGRFRQRMAAAS
jgi:hypothetical protein